MPSLVVSMEEKLKSRMDHFSWVNWSEVAREEALKREIFEEYIRTGSVSDEAWKFCDRIDWHPADWLPLKEEFIKKLKSAKKEPSIRLRSASGIFG